MKKKRKTKPQADPTFPLYLTVRELTAVHEAIQWQRDEHSDGDHLTRIQEQITDILDEISESGGEPIQLPVRRKKTPNRFRSFLSYLAAQVGGFNASPPTNPGRIPAEIENDDYKLACYMHREISRDARKPLEQETLELKAEIYDLKKSIRAEVVSRDELIKENRKLNDQLLHDECRKDAEADL